MPAFPATGFLLDISGTGVVLAVSLLLGTAAARVLRALLSGRRARAERVVRPMVLAVVSDGEVPAALIAARGGQGRAAERIAFAYLAQVRGEAAVFLADLLARRGAVARLIRLTHSPRAHRRARAAERLGVIASPEAERRLAELVTGDHNPEVRIVATRALGKTGSAAAARTLLYSLSRPAPVPAGIVASALLELGPEAVPGLRAELAGGRRQRAMAANVLGLLDELPAWEGLVENVSSGSVEVRTSAVRALGRLGLPQAIGPVTACLRAGEDPALRAAAAYALGRIGDPRSVQPLADCLEDPHYWVAHSAAMALAEIGGPGVTALSLAAAGLDSGAAHAREALARRALARGERPATPAHVSAPAQASALPQAPASASGPATAQAAAPAPAPAQVSAAAQAPAGRPGHPGPAARASRQGR